MLGAHLDFEPYIQRLQDELGKVEPADVRAVADAIFDSWRDGRLVFVFGNGGSATLASHLAEDLGKGCLRQCDLNDENRKRLRILSLTDNVGWLTAIGNDVGYDQIFVQQLMNYGGPGDLAIAISGSGNSPNVLRAAEWCNRQGLRVAAMTGFDGGKLKELQNVGIHVALHDMGMVESVHACLAHWIVDDIFARINTEGRHAG